MAKYTTYASHKVTAITGLENIPEHWEVKQVRYLLLDGQDGIKIGPFGSALKLEDMVGAGYKVYGQENVIKKDFSLGKRWISENKFKAMQVYRVYSGDILITMMGTSGKCEIVPDDYQAGIIDSHLIRLGLKKEKMLPKFFKLLIDETSEIEYQVKIQGKGSIMHGLNSGIIKSLEIPIPPILEQKNILSFLDHETAKIDTLIDKQQTLIKLLKEKRQAVISHAVTKGVNPDAPMKDSGVEWLGEVPEHWEILRLKHLINSLESGCSVNAADIPAQENEIGVLKTSCVYTRTFRVEENKTVFKEDLARVKCPIRKGAIIISRMNTPDLVGASAIIDVDAENIFLPDRLWQTNLSNNFDLAPEFLAYFMTINGFRNQVSLAAEGASSSMQSISKEDYLSINCILPPIQEQKKIIEYIKNIKDKLNDLISKAEQAIQLMQERRTALISAAVTGKIDVRGWRAPE